LGRLLGPLLAETHILVEADHPRGLELYIQTCVVASLALKPLGHQDLAMRLAERAQFAAARLGDPVQMAAADFARAQGALAQGVRGRSLTLASTAADRVQGSTSDTGRMWYGMLHLHAAISAASLGRAADAAAHLDEADDMAKNVSGDPWRMEFTPANVGVWRVGVALENGEPEKAPEYARKVDQTALRTIQRRAHLYIHTGRGLYMAGRNEDAVTAFLQADRVSPHEVRTRPSVREIVGQMIRDARRKAGSDQLRDLAVRCGVDPLAPAET